MLLNLIKELQENRDLKQAQVLQRFFKTGKGEYGEGDKFLGIKIPILKEIVRKYEGLNFAFLSRLLKSSIHEHRQAGIFILVSKFKKSDEIERGNIFNFYLKHLSSVNNWDLVDNSAHHIIGGFLEDKKKDLIYELANSENLWKKRIAMISTFRYISKEEFNDALRIAEILLNDEHDLIHKAVGWMLREIGKRDLKVLESFLKKYYKQMPRTMLRYAIEKFDENKRQNYLKGRI